MRALPLASAQDYKRIFDGDAGPNTGGMGSYSPVPAIDAERAAELVATVHQPVLDELRRRGIEFHGVLYAGLMLTAARTAGDRVQRPLRRPRDAGDPAAAADRPAGAAGGRRRARRPAGSRASSSSGIARSAVTVVLASAGYPESLSQRRRDPRLSTHVADDVFVTHAGTALGATAGLSPPAGGC